VARFLVLSHKHWLLPLAWNLKSSGHDVDVWTWKDRYDRAWKGLFDRTIEGESKRNTDLTAVKQMVEEDELIVLSDSPNWMRRFDGAVSFGGPPAMPDPLTHPTSPVELGGWFTGEEFIEPHWILRDMGAWNGGGGPNVTGGAIGWFNSNTSVVSANSTRTQDEHVTQLIASQKDQLKSSGFQGLVRLGVELDELGGVKVNNISVGWELIHLHLLLALEVDLGSALLDLNTSAHARESLVPESYSVAVPVSVPPWPNQPAKPPKQELVEGLTSEQRRLVGWHDIELHQPDDQPACLRLAGLDGLIGVVRANHKTLPRTLNAVGGVLAALQVPEMQFRSDIGSQVPLFQATLDHLGWL
jgi:hypothetical protein